MHRLLRTLHSKSQRPDEKQKPQRPPQTENSPLFKLPYEVLENILTYAWHGDPTGLPGGGSYVFEDPRVVFVSEFEQDAMSTELAPDPDLPQGGAPAWPALLPAPHTKLTNSAWAGRQDAGVFCGTETYLSLALVCVAWREIMLNVTKTYVSLSSLKKFLEYESVLEIDGPRDDVQPRFKDVQQGKESSGAERVRNLSKSAEKARRLCRSIHIDIPTGNLTMVPSWHDIPAILAPLTSLTHLIITAAEPHPAFLSLLAALPPTITTLDIHISSPFAYKPLFLGAAATPMNTSATIAQTQAEMARRTEAGKTNLESLRSGVGKVKHIFINVIDPVLLGSLLEGFGSMEKSTIKDATSRASTTIYASRALQTVTLQGLHDLTCPEITRTISHSSTVRTLRLYPHTSQPRSRRIDLVGRWKAVEALENKAWFPALENLIVQLPGGDPKQSLQLEKMRKACSKRGVCVDVERSP